MTFGQKLQLIRKKNNLTQEQLATQLYVSRQAVSKWEQDTAMPDVDKLLLISRLFDVSLDYLLKEEIENDVTAASDGRTNNLIDNIINICRKYGYIAGYGLSAVSLYCFIGYVITLVSVIVFSIPPKGFTSTGGAIFGSIYTILCFYMVLSAVGIVVGMWLAKYLKKRTEKYRKGGDSQ